MDVLTVRILTYAKGVAASVGGAITAIVIGLPLLGVETPTWLAIASLVVTAVAVIAVPNKPTEELKAEIINDAIRDPDIPVILDI